LNLLISCYLSILFDVLHEKCGLARIEAQGYLLIRSLFMLNMHLEDVLFNNNVEFLQLK